MLHFFHFGIYTNKPINKWYFKNRGIDSKNYFKKNIFLKINVFFTADTVMFSNNVNLFFKVKAYTSPPKYQENPGGYLIIEGPGSLRNGNPF